MCRSSHPSTDVPEIGEFRGCSRAIFRAAESAMCLATRLNLRACASAATSTGMANARTSVACPISSYSSGATPEEDEFCLLKVGIGVTKRQRTCGCCEGPGTYVPLCPRRLHAATSEQRGSMYGRGIIPYWRRQCWCDRQRARV